MIGAWQQWQRLTGAHVVQGPAPVPLDYKGKFWGRASRYFITDPQAEPIEHADYFTDDVVAWVDVFEDGNFVYLAYVTVRSDYRGQGLASRLIAHVYATYPDAVIEWGDLAHRATVQMYERYKQSHPEQTGRGRKWASRRSQRLASLPFGLYWRVHPKERTFGPDDATSKPLFGGRFRDPDPGYSCVSHPWYVLAYCVAYGWVADHLVDDDDVIGFSGSPLGEGHDGEALVMPDSPSPAYRASWDAFIARLHEHPIPMMSRDLWARHSGLTWHAVAEHLELHNGSEPRYEQVLYELKKKSVMVAL